MTTQVSLEGLRTLGAVLQRLPQGTAAQSLATRLGLWSAPIHDNVDTRRKAFPTEFARLSDADVSDANAYWLSEVFRATELVGLLEGQKIMLTMQAKSARASARAALRRKYRALVEAAAAVAPEGTRPTVKEPSATQLNDEVEEDQQVLDCDATLAMLAVVLESAKAYKEACLAAAAGLSREISFRQAQMGARLR
jgi:hypothetical protein